MHEVIHKAAKNLRKSQQLLEYRRLNWRVIARRTVEEVLDDFLLKAKENDLPFNFSRDVFSTPNEDVVQLSAAKVKLGIVDRKYNSIFETPQYQDTQIIEEGGIFVISQSVTGYINFIVYPRRSDRIAPIDKELLLCSPIDPADLTKSVIEKNIKRYLLILQDSSTIGISDALNFAERLQVRWIYFLELRSRHDFYRSVWFLRGEWIKACIAGLFGFIGGYFATMLTK